MSVDYTQTLTERLCIPVASLFPTNQAIATNNTITAITLKNHRRLIGRIFAGLGGGTVTAYWMGCATSNGTYAALSPNTTAVLNTVNTETTLEVRADQFSSGHKFAQLTITVSGTSSNVAASVYADGHYSPANANDYTLTNATRTVV